MIRPVSHPSEAYEVELVYFVYPESVNAPVYGASEAAPVSVRKLVVSDPSVRE